MSASGSSFEAFVLSSQGKVHDADVRSIVPFSILGGGASHLVTSSRDRTVAIASHGMPSSDTIASELVFTGHTGYVSAVALHPSVPFLKGTPAIISGSQDKHVLLWNPQTTMIEAVLDGHDNLVKCIVVLQNGDFVTAGWDSTAIVWDCQTAEKKLVFREHSNSVLCMCSGGGQLSTPQFVITGSGDKTLLQWDPATGRVQQKYIKHKDAVQAVALVDANGERFASAGNDAVIHVWNTTTADVLYSLVGHDSFVYDLVFLPATNDLVSVSEDRTLRVWRDAQCMQCINLPAQLWCATATASGDIAVGDSTGFVRVWTRNLEAMASPDTIERLQIAVAQQSVDIRQLPTSQKGGGAIALPSLLNSAGDYEGHKKLVNEDPGSSRESLAVYVWCAGQWSRVGTVVRPDVAQQEKRPYKGKLYDFVFDVDLQGRTMKLPYNRGDDVFQAAQMFIYDNAEYGVSQEDKETIIRFLMEQALDLGESRSTQQGGDGVAFSAFAKEEEEMRRAGNAPTSKSFKEVMEEMQNTGNVPMFSQFAKESAELAGGGTAAGGGASTSHSGYSRSVATANDVQDASFHDVVLFKDLPADKVEQRLVTLGKGQEGGETVKAVVQYCADASGGGATPSQLASAVQQVEALIDSLEEGQKLPAIDLWRHLAAHPPQGGNPDGILHLDTAPDRSVIAQTLLPTVLSINAKDAEKIVALRALANIAATSPAGFNTVLRTAGGEGGGELTNVFIAVAKGAPAIRSAAVALMTNLCVRLISDHQQQAPAPEDVFDPASESLVICITAALVYDTENVLPYLRCVSTLLAHPKPSKCRAAVSNNLRRLISVKKDFGDAELVRVAQILFKFVLE